MNHGIARLRLSAPCGTICFACLPLLFILPVSSYAQSELRADKQTLLEAKRGTVAVRKGPDDKLHVLAKPPSSLRISDYSGSSMRQILNPQTCASPGTLPSIEMVTRLSWTRV